MAIQLVEYFRVNALKVKDSTLGIDIFDDLAPNKLEAYKQLPKIEFQRKDVIKIFNQHNIKGGAIDRFLKDRKLFKNPKYGFYKKIISI